MAKFALKRNFDRLPTVKDFKKFRDHIASEESQPLTYREWILGKAAARLMVESAILATKRGDRKSLSASILAIWAGNQSGDGLLAHNVSPNVISKAIHEDRISIIIHPE